VGQAPSTRGRRTDLCYLYFWVKAERKRFRQSLETTDKALAIRTAVQIVLDALARQQVGEKVLSASLGGVIDKWEVAAA
jgi:hypothetical protein